MLYRRALEAYEALGSGLGTAECLDRMGRLAFDIGALGEAEDRLSRALSRYEALGGARALPCRMRLARAVLRRAPGEVWPIVAKIQPRLARLEHTGRVAVAQGLRLLRAALDGQPDVFDEALAEVQDSLVVLAGGADPTATTAVAWLAQLAGEAALKRRLIQRGELALRGAAGIWRALGPISQAAEIETQLGP